MAAAKVVHRKRDACRDLAAERDRGRHIAAGPGSALSSTRSRRRRSAPFASASIQLCLPAPPVASFQIKLLEASLHVGNTLNIFVAGDAPGTIRWTAINTPYKADNTPNAAGTVETQAIDAAPVDAVAHGQAPDQDPPGQAQALHGHLLHVLGPDQRHAPGRRTARRRRDRRHHRRRGHEGRRGDDERQRLLHEDAEAVEDDLLPRGLQQRRRACPGRELRPAAPARFRASTCRARASPAPASIATTEETAGRQAEADPQARQEQEDRSTNRADSYLFDGAPRGAPSSLPSQWSSSSPSSRSPPPLSPERRRHPARRSRSPRRRASIPSPRPRSSASRTPATIRPRRSTSSPRPGSASNLDQPIGATIGTLDGHVTTATVADLRVAGLIKNADPAAVAAAAACTPDRAFHDAVWTVKPQLGRSADRAADVLRRPGGRCAVHGLLRAGARLLRRPGDGRIPPAARDPDAERPLCEPGRRRRVPLDDDPAHAFTAAVRARRRARRSSSLPPKLTIARKVIRPHGRRGRAFIRLSGTVKTARARRVPACACRSSAARVLRR